MFYKQTPYGTPKIQAALTAKLKLNKIIENSNCRYVLVFHSENQILFHNAVQLLNWFSL